MIKKYLTYINEMFSDDDDYPDITERPKWKIVTDDIYPDIDEVENEPKIKPINPFLKDDDFHVGDRVVVRDNYPGGNKDQLINDVGTILKIIHDEDDYYGDLAVIEWGEYVDGHDGGGMGKPGYCFNVRFKHLNKIEEDSDKTTKIKWYKKGKLEEKKLFESKEDIGKKVKMRRSSQYYNQAYSNGGSGNGVITSFDGGKSLPYEIRWDNGHINSYGREDFDFVEERDETISIKWYRGKGEFEEEKIEKKEENKKKRNKKSFDIPSLYKKRHEDDWD